MTPLRRALLLVMLSAATASPCGGPETYPINAPLVTLDAQFEAVQTVSDGLDARVRPELRFLAPFRGTRGVTDALWSHAYPDAQWNPPARYDSTATFVVPDSASLRAAVSRGDWTGADVAARAVVEQVLDLPASIADHHIVTLARAIAWLEGSARLRSIPPSRLVATLWNGVVPQAGDAALHDLYAATHVPPDSLAAFLRSHGASLHRGSVEFALIKRTMRERIPNGWSHDIRESVRPETWASLADMHARWLGAHGEHALAPWVRFARARMAYFQGDSTAAWEPWLALYATGAHRPRVLSEMRYLLQQGMTPPADRRIDDVLHAALLIEQSIGVTEWNRAWNATTTLAPAVRLAVQERLLWHAAGRALGDSLQRLTSFPREAGTPSVLWAALRAMALARGGRRAAALEQLASLEGDSTVAPLRAQLLLGTGRWADGIRTPAIPFASRQYLVRVMAPDSVVATLTADADRRLAHEARLVQAVRLAAAGEWTRGIAALPPGESRRATLWRTAATLSADTTSPGQLAWARWLRQRNGSLFLGNDKPWYRSLNWRLASISSADATSGFNARLPWTADDERRAIGRHVRATYELYPALRAWVAWLGRPGITPAERRRVAREADAAYRWLVDWDANNSDFWKRVLEEEGIGRAIRVAAR